MSRIADWEILIGRAASAMTQRRGDHAPASQHSDNAAGEPSDGLVFLGNVHDTVPRALLLDRRLGAVDVLGWQMIRMLCNADRTTAFPTYDELQPLLRSSIGSQASRGTVARVMAILRLTRWLSLSHRARHETNGRVIGNVYVLHDEPVSPSDASTLDPEYFTLVEASLRHSNRAVRDVAETVRAGLIQNGCSIAATRKVPMASRSHSSEMERLNQRARRFQEMQPTAQSSHGELGQFSHASPQFSERTQSENNKLGDSSQSELSRFSERTPHSSQSELSPKSITYRLVPIENSALTTVRSSNNYLRTCRQTSSDDTGSTRELFWSDTLELASGKRSSIQRLLEVLPFDLQQAVLDETAGKIVDGKSSSPMGLLHTLIKRAATGEFRPTQHAQQQAERRGQRYIQASSSPSTPRPIPRPMPVSAQPQPASELSDEARQQSKQAARAAREVMMKAIGLKSDQVPPALR